MSLRAEIPGEGLKAFSRSLDGLAGYGEELHIQAKKTQLILWTLNMALTAQAIIRISPRFFQKYRLKRPEITNPDNTVVKGDSLKCRVYLKTLRTILKKNQNITSSLEVCEITLVDHPDTDTSVDSLLNVKLICQNGVTKTHSLFYADTDPAMPMFSDRMQHSFTADPAVIADFLQFFHARIHDILIECTATGVKFKSFISDLNSFDDVGMRTEYTLAISDFESYNVQRDVKIAFSLKEFKAALTYAEDIRCPITARFDGPGRPIVFSVQQADLMIADFAVMTHPENPEPSQTHTLHSSTTSYRSLY